MRTDSISYSQKLIDTLDLMIKLDPTLRPSLQDIMQVTYLALYFKYALFTCIYFYVF